MLAAGSIIITNVLRVQASGGIITIIFTLCTCHAYYSACRPTSPRQQAGGQAHVHLTVC